MDVTDTPPHVRRRLVGIYASMTGAERVAYAVEMAEEAKAIAVAGILLRWAAELGVAESLDQALTAATDS